MSQYPTENSLTINTTHHQLDRITAPKKTAATAPTRKMEKGLGYDVQFSFAQRIQFQYKRPQYVHDEYGLTFDVNGHQVGTLRFRDSRSVSYLACPWVVNRAQLSDALDKCYFIDAQGVSTKTTLVHIPAGFDPESPEKAVHGHIPDEGKYEIPPRYIHKWDSLNTNINSRNAGMVIRENGDETTKYEDFVDRLDDLLHIYQPSPYRPDGGEDEDVYQLNQAAVSRLVDHSVSEYIGVYERTDRRPPVDPEVERGHLRNLLEDRYDVRDPQTYGISRSRELLLEDGTKTTPLEVGHR